MRWKKGTTIHHCLLFAIFICSSHSSTSAWGQTSSWLWGKTQPSIAGGTTSWLWITSTPSSHLSPHTCVLAGLPLRATSRGPQEVKAGGATEWETTSAPTALMGFTSGQVRMRSNQSLQYKFDGGELAHWHIFACITAFWFLFNFSQTLYWLWEVNFSR